MTYLWLCSHDLWPHLGGLGIHCWPRGLGSLGIHHLLGLSILHALQAAQAAVQLAQICKEDVMTLSS